MPPWRMTRLRAALDRRRQAEGAIVDGVEGLLAVVDRDRGHAAPAGDLGEQRAAHRHHEFRPVGAGDDARQNGRRAGIGRRGDPQIERAGRGRRERGAGHQRTQQPRAAVEPAVAAPTTRTRMSSARSCAGRGARARARPADAQGAHRRERAGAMRGPQGAAHRVVAAGERIVEGGEWPMRGAARQFDATARRGNSPGHGRRRGRRTARRPKAPASAASTPQCAKAGRCGNRSNSASATKHPTTATAGHKASHRRSHAKASRARQIRGAGTSCDDVARLRTRSIVSPLCRK